MSVTAIIPVHNRADLLSQLLDSIQSQTVSFTEIVVVDNASTDGAGDLARTRGCTVIPLKSNTGFAQAVNIGWRATKTDWIAILNSDVTLEPHWLEHLLAAAQDYSFATGTIYDAARREIVDGTYDLLSQSGCAWRAGFGENGIRRGSPLRIAIAPGTACLFRRNVMEQLNGFDESFESYLEDVDLGLRCLRRGFGGVYVPAAVAWHKGSATLGRWNSRVVRLTSRNQLFLIRRHYDRELFRACFRRILAGQLLWGLVALRHGEFFSWLAGKFDGLRAFRLEGIDSPSLRAFLLASETEIQDRARDPYWRWYFRLTNSSGAAH